MSSVCLIGADWVSDLLRLHISVFTPLLATVAAKKSPRDNGQSWLPAQMCQLEGRLIPKWHPLPSPEVLAVTPLPSPDKNIWPSDQTEAELSVTPDPGCPVPTPELGAAIFYRSGWWPQAGSHDRPSSWCWLASGWQPWLQGQGLRGAQSRAQGSIPSRMPQGPLPACWWERYPTTPAAGCPVLQAGSPRGLVLAKTSAAT